ncbi:ribosome assembly RNA-binding protein YhbY [Tuberibacillus sp. Marseille-P3662]|uniref:ribosome assembly RNA-binding protein YhbY n=1 Tax=Tuberibacillus sp. Marseille-P3662 TaxID=1965358 RepID=UPI000A1CBD26|nr:ribosome assembly RNA-binding protein YhbY [Tuberibacillus sp. Marseille-P3662]
MLTNRQKKFLRKQAHDIKPIFQIGKSGIHQTMIAEIAAALEARELIKISILQNALEDTEEAGQQLASKTDADVVQTIGSTIVLYKESRENKHIELPR